jgi:hypothetical protein
MPLIDELSGVVAKILSQNGCADYLFAGYP